MTPSPLLATTAAALAHADAGPASKLPPGTSAAGGDFADALHRASLKRVAAEAADDRTTAQVAADAVADVAAAAGLVMPWLLPFVPLVAAGADALAAAADDAAGGQPAAGPARATMGTDIALVSAATSATSVAGRAALTAAQGDLGATFSVPADTGTAGAAPALPLPTATPVAAGGREPVSAETLVAPTTTRPADAAGMAAVASATAVPGAPAAVSAAAPAAASTAAPAAMLSAAGANSDAERAAAMPRPNVAAPREPSGAGTVPAEPRPTLESALAALAEAERKPSKVEAGSAPAPSAVTTPMPPAAREMATIVRTLDTPVAAPGWHDEIARHLSDIVSLRSGEAELRLNPANLGPVGVEISYSGKEASVLITAVHPATRDALEQALPQLRELLAQQGIALGEANVRDPGAGGGNQSPSNAGGAAPDHGDRTTAATPATPTALRPAATRLVDTFA